MGFGQRDSSARLRLFRTRSSYLAKCLIELSEARTVATALSPDRVKDVSFSGKQDEVRKQALEVTHHFRFSAITVVKYRSSLR